MTNIAQRLPWLSSAYNATLGTDIPVFERFCSKFDDHFTVMKSSNMKDLKKNAMKIKGDHFEDLCYELLRAQAFANLPLTYLWKFQDIPDDIRAALGLTQRDMGIDLVGCTATEWVAIQCKYRKKPNSSRRPDGSFNKWQVSWTELSTFLALATNNRFARLIIMTSAPSVSWQGHYNTRCTVFARGSFLGIDREIWSKLCGDTRQTLGSVSSVIAAIPSNNLNEQTRVAREARAAWLDKLDKK